jgi:hypothetical protein
MFAVVNKSDTNLNMLKITYSLVIEFGLTELHTDNFGLKR